MNDNNRTPFDGIKRKRGRNSSEGERGSFTFSESDFYSDNNSNWEKERASFPRQKNNRWKGIAAEVVRFALIALLIVVPIRVFVAQPFIVNGASMDPTFSTGQYLIVDQLTNRFEAPERGSVIVFKYPKDPSKFFIKRVIGLPTETVEIIEGTVTIKNEKSPGGFVLEEPYVTHKKEDNLKVSLQEDEYFVMGDNRAGSSDSRIWGPLKEELITGRAFIRLLPLNKIELFPGKF